MGNIQYLYNVSLLVYECLHGSHWFLHVSSLPSLICIAGKQQTVPKGQRPDPHRPVSDFSTYRAFESRAYHRCPVFTGSCFIISYMLRAREWAASAFHCSHQPSASSDTLPVLFSRFRRVSLPYLKLTHQFSLFSAFNFDTRVLTYKFITYEYESMYTHERTVRKKTGGAQWKMKNYNISEFQRKWNIS